MAMKFVVLSSIVIVLSGSSLAQTYGLPGSQPIDPVGYYINQSFWSNKAFTTAMTQSLMRSGAKGRSRAAAPKSNAASSVTSFRATSPILPALLANANPNAASQAEMRSVIEHMLALFRQTAAKDGFPANDLAYAFEYFVVNNYQAYNHLVDPYADPEIAQMTDPLARIQAYKTKQTQQVTLTQERTIYEQFKRVLSENPEVRKMTDRQKQEATELLAVSTGMAITQYLHGVRNKSADQLEKGRRAAGKNLERLATNADRVTISNSGLQF